MNMLEENKIYNKRKKTFEILKGCWLFLKKNPKLLFITLITFFFVATIPLIFLILLFVPMFSGKIVFEAIALYIFLFFLSLVLAYPIFIFFEIAIIYCTNKALKKETFSFKEGLLISRRKIRLVFKWIFLNLTFRTSLIGDPKNISPASSLVTAGWDISTTFVIYIIILENLRLEEAIAKSFQLFKKVWKNATVFEFSTGPFFVILGIGGFFLINGFFYLLMDFIRPSSSLDKNFEFLLISSWFLLIVILFILGIITTTLREIFLVILYNFSNSNEYPQGFFDEKIIKEAFKEI